MSTQHNGLLTPFRRDKKRDFASGSGAELLKSKVIQALATEGATPASYGELPWREFGSALHLLRHQRNDDILSELAGVYVRDALKKWVPEVEVVRVEVERDDEDLNICVRFREVQTPLGSSSVNMETTDLWFNI